MPLFTVNPDLCRRDGLCAAVCPASLVRMDGPEATPAPLAGKEAHCIGCGHCAAICPTGALTLENLPPTTFTAIDTSLAVSPEAFAQVLATRRSTRVFRSEGLPRETLDAVFAAAGHAPTGHNAQPVSFVVLATRQAVTGFLDMAVAWMRQEVKAKTPRAVRLNLAGAARAYQKGKDVIGRGAPHLVLVHAPTDGVTPDLDAVIACAQLDLAAHALGLGSCWCGYAIFACRAHRPLSEAIGIPAENSVYAALLLGRPAIRHRLIPPRKTPDVRFIADLA